MHKHGKARLMMKVRQRQFFLSLYEEAYSLRFAIKTTWRCISFLEISYYASAYSCMKNRQENFISKDITSLNVSTKYDMVKRNIVSVKTNSRTIADHYSSHSTALIWKSTRAQAGQMRISRWVCIQLWLQYFLTSGYQSPNDCISWFIDFVIKMKLTFLEILPPIKKRMGGFGGKFGFADIPFSTTLSPFATFSSQTSCLVSLTKHVYSWLLEGGRHMHVTNLRS